MPRFAANLSLMFQEHAFLDRFAAAADAGFRAVEFQFPYAWPAHEIASRLQACQLELVMFNLPPGDWESGERGLAIYPDRRGEFQAALGLGLQYAERLGVRQLHVMAGTLGRDEASGPARRAYLDNLREAGSAASQRGITLLIEPLNLRDNPGYFLHDCGQAAAIIAEAGLDNLRLQLDFYHAQISTGDLVTQLEEHFGIVGHVQVAGVPGRHEPDEGEINYPWLFQLLDAWGYAGHIGCEYRPRGTTRSGLRWLDAVAVHDVTRAWPPAGD